MSVKIGVYVCHCGTNISGKVNVSEVRDFATTLPCVEVSREYKFMCSDPGQILIQDDIRNLGLDRIVVASCSPLMHEPTFRGACERARSQPLPVSDGEHPRALFLGHGRSERRHGKGEDAGGRGRGQAATLVPLPRKTVPVNNSALVVGGGIAGIQAALDIADSGRTVLPGRKGAVDRRSHGHVRQNLPNLGLRGLHPDPKMVQVGKHPNIRLYSSSEVEEVTGFVGNFKVKVRHKAAYVDHDKCTGCGMCWESCPARKIPTARVIKKGKLMIAGPRRRRKVTVTTDMGTEGNGIEPG